MTIPGFPGYVLVRTSSKDWDVVSTRSGVRRVLRGNVEARGRVRFSLHNDAGQTASQLGRWVLLATQGPPPPGRPFACHRDDDPTNNDPANLYWGSPQDNADDARRHGRHLEAVPRGEAHKLCTIPDDVVAALRSEYVKRPPGHPRGVPKGSGPQPGSPAWLAVKYGLDAATVARIVRGRSRVAPGTARRKAAA